MVQPRFFTQPDDAARELYYFAVTQTEEFPADMYGEILRLLEPGKSISFAVSEAAELIYARQKELSKKVIALGAELAITASHYKINNFGDDGGKRGRGIAEALRRASGEKAPAGMSWSSKREDPDPKSIYVPATGSEAEVAPPPEPLKLPQ